MSKPTLIFCPGAWYPPTAFNPLIERLPDYTSHTIAFPSIQQATTVKDLQPDISALRSIVQRECDQGHEVVIISHSWSGLPVSSALDSLSCTHRQKAGQEGGVVKLILLSAFILDVGQSLLQAFGGQAPDWYIRDVCNLSSFVCYFCLCMFADSEKRKRTVPYQPTTPTRSSSTTSPMANNGPRRCVRMHGQPKFRPRPVHHT